MEALLGSGTFMIGTLLIWYAAIQLVGLAALPLLLRLCRALPDRGIAMAKATGILLTGVILWLGASYGLLRNDAGGAWLALGALGLGAWIVGWDDVGALWRTVRNGRTWRYVLAGEILFAVAFVAWAFVRAHDPAADHTEQPMDLMFMNSIWASPTYPPQDAWLAGYPISYYYLGYWLLTTLGHITAQPPEVVYTVGQASWLGLLVLGSFGVGANLLAYRGRSSDGLDHAPEAGRPQPVHGDITWGHVLGGVLSAVCVALVGNLMVVLEWFYAQGWNLTWIADFVAVHNFPERASQSGNWYIGMDWWWWRSSRVLQDLDLLGEHIEVIDEFPAFSYVLGDNHPHVLAMPIALVVVGLAMNILFAADSAAKERAGTGRWWERLAAVVPGRWLGLGLLVIVLGALVFLNTWDFPPYWLLTVAASGIAAWVTTQGVGRWWLGPLLLGGTLVLGAIAVYLPYFLTAQSQADGIAPNLFNPTRVGQFGLMFGQFVPGVAALLLMTWRGGTTALRRLGLAATVVIGFAVLFLALSVAIGVGTEYGRAALAGELLPEGATGYLPFILERWSSQPWTFLLVGLALAVVVTNLWQALHATLLGEPLQLDAVFALLLTAVGLALVYAPEFIYLRDNFGTRMNTVFKFYYQGWLLLALAAAFGVAAAFRARPTPRRRPAQGLALASLALLLGAGLYLPAAVYSKTDGFTAASLTFDATAYAGTDELAAIAWIRTHTPREARVLEGKGASYSAAHNRVSAMTGRATLLGWDGHESQWRGDAYAEMARRRPEALVTVYRDGTPDEVRRILREWDIDYVYLGPTEIAQYGVNEARLRRLSEAMDLVFEQGQVRVFRR
jgi:YYY domain-containing protein